MSKFSNVLMAFLVSASVMAFAVEPGEDRIQDRADTVTNEADTALQDVSFVAQCDGITIEFPIINVFFGRKVAI